MHPATDFLAAGNHGYPLGGKYRTCGGVAARAMGDVMVDDERLGVIKGCLFEYVKSPSLKHIRDPYNVIKLAGDILKQIDRNASLWRKWEGQRETLVQSAVGCWIPLNDLRDVLNEMPGQKLTDTDVDQRLKAFEDYWTYAKEEHREGCLALYEQEKAKGTELPAIIGMLREHLEQEEERLRVENQQRYLENRDKERAEREQRLLSGADCTWTEHQKFYWYCRINGRTYRLSPTMDKMWHLHRVETVAAQASGALLGKYQKRMDATKALKVIAYQPEL